MQRQRYAKVRSKHAPFPPLQPSGIIKHEIIVWLRKNPSQKEQQQQQKKKK